MTRREFERLVDEAVAGIPEDFRDQMRNLVLVIEDEPSGDLLEEMGIAPPDTLYGLYQGTPLTERDWSHETLMPDRITLFRGPIEADGPGHDDIRAAIAETLIHEIGHYFGLSEEEIEEIEERYWRGGGDPDGDGPA